MFDALEGNIEKFSKSKTGQWIIRYPISLLAVILPLGIYGMVDLFDNLNNREDFIVSGFIAALAILSCLLLIGIQRDENAKRRADTDSSNSPSESDSE